MKSFKNIAFLAYLIIFGAASFAAFPAHSADKLYSPYVKQGEWELEYFGTRNVDSDANKDDAQKQQFSIGYGVTERWKTELYAKYNKGAQQDLVFDAYEWENIFQFTERGENWVDVGGSLAYEFTPQEKTPDKIETRLLLAKDLDKTSHAFNLIFEKDIGDGPKAALEGKLIWSSRYNLSKYFEPGFEISSDLGELKNFDKFDQQDHYVGPAAYGKIPLGFAGQFDAIKYRIGYLFGVSTAASEGQSMAQLEYELRF